MYIGSSRDHLIIVKWAILPPAILYVFDPVRKKIENMFTLKLAVGDFMLSFTGRLPIETIQDQR